MNVVALVVDEEDSIMTCGVGIAERSRGKLMIALH